MSDRDRSRLFAAAALVLIGAGALILGVLGGPATREQDASGQRDGSPGRTILASTPDRERRGAGDARYRVGVASRHGGEDLPAGARPGPATRVDPQAGRQARRFVSALLDVETGSPSPARREALRRSSTPAIARRVLGAPARVPPGSSRPARGALTALEPLRAPGGGLAFVATIRRDGRRTGLVLLMTGRGDRWRVSGIR